MDFGETHWYGYIFWQTHARISPGISCQTNWHMSSSCLGSVPFSLRRTRFLLGSCTSRTMGAKTKHISHCKFQLRCTCVTLQCFFDGIALCIFMDICTIGSRLVQPQAKADNTKQFYKDHFQVEYISYHRTPLHHSDSWSKLKETHKSRYWVILLNSKLSLLNLQRLTFTFF